MARSDVASHGVFLGPRADELVRVGTLLRDSAATVRFVVDEGYVARGAARPLLSAAWWDPDDEEQSVARLRLENDKIGRHGRLSPWFSNLLPEGALRSLVLSQMGAGEHDELDMLIRLGGDLPGAVWLCREGEGRGLTKAPGERHEPAARPLEGTGIKFSLAGVQLKLSMVEADSRLTMPASGQGGKVIVKLPTEAYPGLCEAEYVGLALARAAGVETAAFELRAAEEVEGIPARWLAHGTHVLAVRRFDRTATGRRIHIEDFAQILGAVGDEKYSRGNDETNLRLLSHFAEDAPAAVLEAVRRMTVNILVGNGDAHLKNWSLLHASGERPRLAPAYDIVPTMLYGDTTMAMKLGGTRDPTRMRLQSLERAARFAGMAAKSLTGEAIATVTAAAECWPALLRELPAPAGLRAALSARWRALRVTSAVSDPFSG